MSKHITTHLFFHMDSGGSKQKDSGTTSSSAPRKAKKSSNLSSGYEIDTNPPLPTESGDYYDYYTNYGIPDYYGPMSPTSPPFLCGRDDLYNYYDYRNNEYDYYPNPNEADYGDGGGGGGGYGNANHYDRAYTDRPHNAANPSTSAMIPHGYGSGSGHIPYPHHLQPPLISPPIQPPRASSPLSPFPPDLWSAYRSDSQGLSAISHKLHRITFVEACIFQPPDLPSPVRPLPSSTGATTAQPPPPPPSSLPLHSASGQAPGSVPPVRPPVPVLAQGERSPTSTGGTQYYQEWTSKHMRHLCSRFEKPSQQQLLMNVERKSKYPFIILCTPERGANPALSKSSSTSSGKARAAPVYRREISQHSAYSLEEEDEEEDEEAHWITQKQRDSINNHYLPPPPPPLLMPHIWPEIRYIDGLYTVCASIIRPGSGVADDFDESLYLGQDTTTMANTGPYAEQANYSGNMHDYQYNPHEKHISFQDSISQHSAHTGGSGGSGKGSKEKSPRPAGYIVSAFATFPGEDSERLEKNWLLWTGARILYKYLPMCVGLRRLIFLKRCPDMYREDMATQNKIKPTIFTGFTYVLLCECFNLKDAYIASVCTTIDQLRARCCGYSALYLTHFQQKQQQQQASHEQHIASSSRHHHYQQQQQQHHHHHQPHHIPRHHRSTDFTEFDAA